MARKTTLERLLSEIINASARASGTWMQAETRMMSRLLNKEVLVGLLRWEAPDQGEESWGVYCRVAVAWGVFNVSAPDLPAQHPGRMSKDVPIDGALPSSAAPPLDLITGNGRSPKECFGRGIKHSRGDFSGSSDSLITTAYSAAKKLRELWQPFRASCCRKPSRRSHH